MESESAQSQLLPRAPRTREPPVSNILVTGAALNISSGSLCGHRSSSPSSCSPPSSPPLPGSAVSALQSKVKAKSQRMATEREKEDLFLDVSSLQSVRKKNDVEGLPPAPPYSSSQGKRPNDENVLEPQPQVHTHLMDSSPRTKQDTHGKTEKEVPSAGESGLTRELGEGSSLENLALGGTGDSPGDALTSKQTSSSSPRHWAPPKGFWRVARPETLLLNGEGTSSLVLPKEAAQARVDGTQRSLKPNTGGREAVIQRELQRADSWQTAVRKCPQEASPADPLARLWRADSWETVCSRAETLSDGEKVERSQKYIAKHKNKGKDTRAVHPGGQYQLSEDKGLPPYKLSDWNSATIPYETELNYRFMFPTADVTLSPRHEHAKRLLERARLKSRTQTSNDELPVQMPHVEGLEMLSVVGSSPVHRTVIVTSHDDLVTRGRDSERDIRSHRHGHSPTRVRFEDESEKEAERRYLDRVRERGPVEKPQTIQTPKPDPYLSVPEMHRGLGSSWGTVGIPMTLLTKEEGHTMEIVVPPEEVLRKCEACGSILGPILTSDTLSKAQFSCTEPQGKPVPRWVTPAQSSHSSQPTIIGAFTSTEGLTLVDSTGGTSTGEADERVSGFGKLRRRSKTWESRVETGHGPYPRSQNLWAQRRNSKTKSNLEECTHSHSQSASTSDQGISFTVESPSASEHCVPLAATFSASGDSASTQLPIKSALKSGSKSRSSGPRVVKLLPSVQYRLIHLDQQMEGNPQLMNYPNEEQLGGTINNSSQSLPSTSGLTPRIKTSTLRYSPAMLTPELQALEISATGHLADEDVCRDQLECRPGLRCGGMSKPEDLRAELLRAEHRKAELLWDDGLTGARRGMEREGRPKLSLRRFFSAMGLNSVGKLVTGSRSNSMEQLSSPPTRPSSASVSPTHRTQAQLQRTPSLQAIHTDSPLAQLRKASSAQSLQSPKRRTERSTILGDVPLPYGLAASCREAQRAGSGEELDGSRGTGPLGQLVQAFPDGTLLLELTRPANGPFGFVISRGKGRPSTGIYVDQVGDNSSENIYTGLLGAGDEILEVNGEKVAGLTLDQVTRLLTRDSTATIRIVPHRWIQH